MDEDDFELREEAVLDVLEIACEIGWLKPVKHGYCFYCHTEKPVYDVIMKDVPVQPPRCESCFVKAAVQMASDPETRERIRKQFDELL